MQGIKIIDLFKAQLSSDKGIDINLITFDWAYLTKPILTHHFNVVFSTVIKNAKLPLIWNIFLITDKIWYHKITKTRERHRRVQDSCGSEFWNREREGVWIQLYDLSKIYALTIYVAPLGPLNQPL